MFDKLSFFKINFVESKIQLTANLTECSIQEKYKLEFQIKCQKFMIVLVKVQSHLNVEPRNDCNVSDLIRIFKYSLNGRTL